MMAKKKVPYDCYNEEKECVMNQLKGNNVSEEALAEIYDWYYPEKTCKVFYEAESCNEGLNNGCMDCIVDRITREKEWANTMYELLKHDIEIDFFDDHEMFVIYVVVFGSAGDDPLQLLSLNK